jgi:cupin superfamily acireductone dioxygenase involved in methionine salvage
MIDLRKCDCAKAKTHMETVEKFANELKALYDGYDEYDELYVKTIRENIDEICKKFTEGEIC